MRRFVIGFLALLLLPALAALPATATPRSTAGPPEPSTARPYTVTTLHFAAVTGPRNQRTCDVVGDLYLPRKASRHHRVPAILTTNGFSGSKDDQAAMGRFFASRGYAVLSYSGLGFGGSDCKITLDDPDWDGKAASRLVSYLGGRAGVAFRDAAHTEPVPRLRVIKRDAVDHRGRHRTHDPRVGMIGGSYGGAVQFAAAAVDARVDTIIPMITWHDLSYSLAPNNIRLADNASSTNPGAVKLVWALGFSALGVVNGVSNAATDPRRLLPCPNFATWVCPALVTGAAAGYLPRPMVRRLRHASVATMADRVRIPTLLMQGQADTLFNLNEAVATYRDLRRRGTEVKMIWHSWGHSDSVPAAGELDLGAPNARAQYLTGRIVAWFDRYLRDRQVSTGPRFSYFRPWVKYRGNAAPAYGRSSAFPVGKRREWFLSGRDQLRGRGEPKPGWRSFVTAPAGLPTSLSKLDAVGSMFTPENAADGPALPGTYAAWKTPALQRPVEVAGIPEVRLRLHSLTGRLTGLLGPAGQVVLFAKVVDIAPDGTRRMIEDTIAPIRIPEAGEPFTVRLPGIVHKFEAGHRIGLVVSGGSTNYRGNVLPATVTIASGTHNTLSLPVLR